MPQAREVKTWTNVSKFERIDQDQSLACWHHQQETTTALTLMLPQSHNMQREKKESIIDTNLINDMIWFVKIPCSSRVEGCGRLKVRGIRGWSRKRRGEKETNGKKILGDKYKAGTDLERDKIKRAWTWAWTVSPDSNPEMLVRSLTSWLSASDDPCTLLLSFFFTSLPFFTQKIS